MKIKGRKKGRQTDAYGDSKQISSKILPEHSRWNIFFILFLILAYYFCLLHGYYVSVITRYFIDWFMQGISLHNIMYYAEVINYCVILFLYLFIPIFYKETFSVCLYR